MSASPWWILSDPSVRLAIVVSMISHNAVHGMIILWWEVTGTEPEGWRKSWLRGEGVCSSLLVVSDLDLVPVHCAALPEHPSNAEKHLFHTDLISVYLSDAPVPSCLLFFRKSISSSERERERERMPKYWKRGSRRVSDFHPWHQWSSLNSSTQYNPQPVGKCEKLHKVIYTLMSSFPKNTNGMQFKDNTATFSSFSNLIPRGLY